MSIKRITLAACAAAASLASASAFALSQNAIDPQNPGPNDLVIHYAGSTAQEQAVRGLASDFCATTPDEYTNASGPTNLVLTCTLKSAAPVPAAIQGKNLYFSYYENGGSIYGVTPVIDQISLNYMKVFGGTCSGTSPTFTCNNSDNGVGQPPTADQYAHTPVAGGSDVEPALFKGSNVAGLAFAAPQGSNYTALQAFNVIFALAVNCDILDHSVYTGCTGAGGPIKSLSKTSVASIFDGTAVYWEQVPEYGQADDGSGHTLADDWAVYATNPGHPIHVCRRKPGSGTQASAEAYFLHQECGGPARSFVTAATAAIPGNVEEWESSTDILTKCEDVNANSIAISSIEKGPHASWGNNWDYVNLNGVAPTLQNAATGAYDYMFENSMQYNTAVANANQVAFLTAMFNAAKSASSLAGKAGVLAIPDPSIGNNPGDQTDSNSDGKYIQFLASNPVAWDTRDGLACKPEHLVFP